MKDEMRRPGFEPRSPVWQTGVLPGWTIGA